MRDKLTFLQDLARRAGHIMLEHWNKEIQVFEKPDKTIVTQVDLEISRMVCENIIAAYPDAGLLTEETSGKLLYPKRTGFIVDELDGTYSYFKRRPGFNFQCAYYENFGEIRLGLIYDPLRDIMLYSLRDEGVWICENGVERNVPKPTEKPWLRLRFGHHRQFMSQTHKKMYAVMGVRKENIVPTGSIGSKSIDFALGKIDVIIALNRAISAWDWAPGKAILEELGYSFKHITGEEVQMDYPSDFHGFGYLVCPKKHEEKFRKELQWIVRKVTDRKRHMV